MAWFRRPIRRRPDGTIEVRLDQTQRDLIRAWTAELRTLLEDDEHRPVLRRLEPPAYGQDVVRDAEYQALMGSELRSSRREALDSVAANIDATVLDEAQAVAWMQAINAVRLVLGTHLDVSEDSPALVRGPDEGLWATYHLLSVVLEQLVDALGSTP